MVDETISEKCETLYNKLNTFVASVISRDVTPKISNLNTEVWGSDTQTGSSRIDTLNNNLDNLNSSITSMESDINNVESDVSNLQTNVTSLSTTVTNMDTIYGKSMVLSSNVWSNGNNLYLYRIGKLVIAFIPSGQLRYSSTGWQSMITLPTGYHPRINTPLAVINNSSETFNQWRTNNNVLQVYCATANKTEYTGCFGVWVTEDDYPSE